VIRKLFSIPKRQVKTFACYKGFLICDGYLYDEAGNLKQTIADDELSSSLILRSGLLLLALYKRNARVLEYIWDIDSFYPHKKHMLKCQGTAINYSATKMRENLFPNEDKSTLMAPERIGEFILRILNYSLLYI
jgi:hypothetical protein